MVYRCTNTIIKRTVRLHNNVVFFINLRTLLKSATITKVSFPGLFVEQLESWGNFS